MTDDIRDTVALSACYFAEPDVAISQLLSDTQQRLLDGDIFNAMESLDIGLGQLRLASKHSDWAELSRAVYIDHPIKQLLENEPVTRHSFRKPRGYAGDAELLDYIYQPECPRLRLTELGRQLRAWGSQTPAEMSVKARRDLLASELNDLLSRHDRQEILSVACGHLREAHMSPAFASRRFHRYVGLDNDGISLSLVKEQLGGRGVQVVQESIKRLAFARPKLGHFDWIYSAGLYDYLVDSIAIRLSKTLFSMLKPRGRLLIANFAPNLRDIGYMEVIMDWKLIYRDEERMNRLLHEIPPEEISNVRVFREKHNNIVFLELTRK